MDVFLLGKVVHTVFGITYNLAYNQNMEDTSLPPDQNHSNFSLTKNLIAVFIILAVIGAGYVVFKSSYQKQVAAPIEPSSEVNLPEQELKDGWKLYRNGILGIEFLYPESWGEPYTDPKYLTDLNAFSIAGSQSQNGKQIFIRFNKVSGGPQVILFDNKTYGLEDTFDQTKGYLDTRGFLDKVSKLRETGDICEYSFVLHYPAYRVNYAEIYNFCENGLKKNIIQTTQFFQNPDHRSEALFSYKLNNFAYAKASNNFFPDILIKYTSKVLSQQKAPLTYEQFLKAEGGAGFVEKIDDSDFLTFVKSIKSIPTYTISRSKVEILSSDSNNIKIVKNYFNLLAGANYKEAFSLLSNPKQTESEFVALQNKVYDEVINEINIYNMDKVEVFLSIQLHNQWPEQYHQVFEVKDSRIQLILEEKINGKISTFGAMRAYASERNGQSIVVLQNGSQEKIIDSVELPKDNLSDAGSTFYSPEFSPKGQYIKYSIAYYEGSGSNIYDILNDKILNISLPKGNFNPEESLYFSCVFDEAYGPTEATIYNVPGFSIKTDLLKIYPELKDYWNYECSYDEKTDIETYIFSGKIGNKAYDSEAKKIYKLNGVTGEIIPF